MANTISVVEKPIPEKVSKEAYVLGIQDDGSGKQALYRLPIGDVRANGTNDLFIIPALIDQYGTKQALTVFINANAEYDSLTKLADRFFKAAASAVTQTYTTQFYRYNISNSPLGTKMADNEGLVCTPSTNATAGQDDYADLPLFACFDVNYTVDETSLEPIIHAIKGVYGNFTAQPINSLVGVMQMAGYVRRSGDETTKTVEYKAQYAEGFKPLPEAIRATDNAVRGFMIHAKYAAGYNSAGLLSSVSGVQPATKRNGSTGSTAISFNGQIKKWREWGNQYCGSSLCDIAFIQLMLEIKYATLGSAQVMRGCRNYFAAYTAAVSEMGVTRVLLTAEQGAYFVVGSCVSVGSTSDRSKETTYDVCDITKILSIEDVTVNGTAYTAINLDTETPFNTTTGTYIVTQPWQTGSTDSVLGNDGSPTSNSSGKDPCKIQGIEVMIGIYEVLGDTTLLMDNEKYNVYLNRKAADIAGNNSGTNPVTAGTITILKTASWRYISELNWDVNNPESYVLSTQFNGTSSTGYCSAVYAESAEATGWREWLAFGDLGFGGYINTRGFVYAQLIQRLGGANWHIGARACGSGGNRGEFTSVCAGV